MTAVALSAPAGLGAAKPVRFKVTIDASRTTTWSLQRTQTWCTTIDIRGAGEERVRFRTVKPIVTTLSALRNGIGGSVAATATRTGELTEALGAPCQWSDGSVGCSTVAALGEQYMGYTRVSCPATIAAPTTDCGTRRFSIRRGTGFYLGYGDGYPTELGVQLMVQEPIFRNCPGLGRAPRGIFNVTTRISPQALAKRRVTIIRGSTDMFFGDIKFPEEPGLTGATLASWTVRIERIR